MPTAETAVSDYERERGKPMPSKQHGYVQARLSAAFTAYEPEYVGLSELTLELDGWEVTPDLCVYARGDIDLTREEVRVDEPPRLAVEIASPTQGTQELVDKARRLIEHGVASGWLVQPALRTITIFGDDGRSKTHSEGRVSDPATSIEVSLEDVFRGMEA